MGLAATETTAPPPGKPAFGRGRNLTAVLRYLRLLPSAGLEQAAAEAAEISVSALKYLCASVDTATLRLVKAR
jgi:hypothetical protein